MNNLTFREYQKEDALAFEEIIRKTWQFDSFCGKQVSKSMSSVYLLECISQQTFTQVALLNNTPIGIIMCANKHIHKTSLWIKAIQVKAILSLLLTKEGRKTAKVFGSIANVDTNLLATQSKIYDGELVFFAVSEDHRGTGVGKALFEKAINYMKSQQIEDFYLYTDSSCNYQFYERQGMLRIAEKSYSLPLKIKNEMNFYLYEYRGIGNGK